MVCKISAMLKVRTTTAFSAWIAREGLRKGQVARDLGLTPSYFSQLVNGRLTPSLPVALRIHQFTGLPVEEMWQLEQPDSDAAA